MDNINGTDTPRTPGSVLNVEKERGTRTGSGSRSRERSPSRSTSSLYSQRSGSRSPAPTRHTNHEHPKDDDSGLVQKGAAIRVVDGASGGTSEGGQDTHLQRSVLNSIVIVLTVTFGMIINVANTTAMSISMPTIQREMQLEAEQLQWIVSAYPLSSGCLLLVCGRLADLYGRKKAFLLGTAILAVFTLACGFSHDVVTLDVLRAIQGIGSAATIPASLGILAQSFPPSTARSLAFATFSAGAPTGAVFGTSMGGLLTEFSRYTWRSSFFLLAGINVLCFVGAWFAVDQDLPSEESDRRVDWLGATLVTVGLVLIVFVLSQGEIAAGGWGSAYIIALLIVGILFVAAFLYWQYHLERIMLARDQGGEKVRHKGRLSPPPLMKLSLWTRANGRLAAIMAIAFTNWCGFLAWTFWVQLYYQNYLSLSAMSSVVRLLPMFVSGIICNTFVGLMAARVPLLWIITIGTSSTSLACLLFAVIEPRVTYWAYAFPASFLSVVGADFVFSAGTLFIAKFAAGGEQSVAGALFNTMIQLGTAVGITVTTVVFNAVSKKPMSINDPLKPYRFALWASFAFGVIATILGFVFFRGVGVAGERKSPSSRTRDGEYGEREGSRPESGSSTFSAEKQTP